MLNKEYRPTLAQLRAFTAIADHRHFGTAATELGISQPSLSQALVALEQGLEIQLIERSTRRVIVTQTGIDLLPYTRAVLDAVDRFLSKAQGVHGGLVGSLRIGMIPTITPYLLPHILTLIPEQTPDMIPNLLEEKTRELETNLRQGKIDLAVMAMPVTSVLDAIELYKEEFVLVLPKDHPLVGRNDIRLSDLRDLSMLLLDEGHCLRDQVRDICEYARGGGDEEIIHSATKATSLATIIQCVAGGMGATLVPLSAVSAECRRAGIGLATFSHEETLASRTIALCVRRSMDQEDDLQTLAALFQDSYDRAAQESRAVMKENFNLQ